MKGMVELGGGFWLSEDGVVYTTMDGALARPFDRYPDDEERVALMARLEGREYRFDNFAPYRCSKCGTDRLQVSSSGPWETSARCPDCEIEEVVHDG